MTALKEFQRLESEGLWRPDAEAQRRDVTISFGDATLVISDSAMRPLSHWSLPAVIRLNPGERPALFTPGEDSTELLELTDDIMIGAIEKVRKAIIRARPRTGKLRLLTTAAIFAGFAGIVLLWAPGALMRQTLEAVPLSKRTEIGATLLGHIQRLTGPTCRDARGVQALGLLKNRLLGVASTGQIVVVPDLAAGAVALPGAIIAVDQKLIENYDGPDVVAGYVLAADAQREINDPLAQLLRDAGLRMTFTLLTTGDLPPEVLADEAAAIVARGPDWPNAETLIDRFDRADVSPAAFADTASRDMGWVAQLRDDDPTIGRDLPIILQDGDFVRMQGICTR